MFLTDQYWANVCTHSCKIFELKALKHSKGIRGWMDPKMTTHVLSEAAELQRRRGTSHRRRVTKLESDPPLRRPQSGRRIDGLTAQHRPASRLEVVPLCLPPRRSVDMFHIRGEQCCFSATFCNLFAHLGKSLAACGQSETHQNGECQSQRGRYVSPWLP